MSVRSHSALEPHPFPGDWVFNVEEDAYFLRTPETIAAFNAQQARYAQFGNPEIDYLNPDGTRTFQPAGTRASKDNFLDKYGVYIVAAGVGGIAATAAAPAASAAPAATATAAAPAAVETGALVYGGFDSTAILAASEAGTLAPVAASSTFTLPTVGEIGKEIGKGFLGGVAKLFGGGTEKTSDTPENSMFRDVGEFSPFMSPILGDDAKVSAQQPKDNTPWVALAIIAILFIFIFFGKGK
jgi:hypothetical protein